MNIFKKISIFFCFTFFLVLLFSKKISAEVDIVQQIKIKMETNSFVIGNNFKVGIMDNFYQVETKYGPAKVYKHVYLLHISDNIPTTEIKNNEIQRKFYPKDSLIVGFDGSVPRGYGKTLLYLLGLNNDKIATGDNNSENYRFSCILGTMKSIYTTEIITNTMYYTLPNENYKKYDFVCLYLVADVIEAPVSLSQYQRWWWGNQNLWSSNLTAYIMCNIREEISYGMN